MFQHNLIHLGIKNWLETIFFNIRGSGVLPKGQHSWNISATKEARVDPKVVLESSMECPSLVENKH